ncbi:reverse transcriptase domain-containing protein [Tanacetum coccineum]
MSIILKHMNLSFPYPEKKNRKKAQKDKVQLQKFWKMFKQLHFNISLADAMILMPKYTKMLKDLCANKEKLEELANTPLSENCSAVILKKLPEKLGDSCRFTIPCDFSKLKCQGLADLGASINLMPPLGLSLGKFTYPADFVVVDYVPDEQIPLILGRPFLRTARALIDVYDEKLILRG